ncbi:MAG: head decoration protein [Lachnospiraceae bacterium]|nr:head decoration protein [Lachnospiraceae bacterium]
MSRLDENLGAVGFDNLINGLYPPAEPFSVTIRKESTKAVTYKRGTVLALSGGTAGDGKRVILGATAATNETLTANCVLAEDVEVGTENDAAAIAYRTGHFNGNNLIVAESYKITAGDKEALRSAGILLSDAVAI